MFLFYCSCVCILFCIVVISISFPVLHCDPWVWLDCLLWWGVRVAVLRVTVNLLCYIHFYSVAQFLSSVKSDEISIKTQSPMISFTAVEVHGWRMYGCVKTLKDQIRAGRSGSGSIGEITNFRSHRYKVYPWALTTDPPFRAHEAEVLARSR